LKHDERQRLLIVFLQLVIITLLLLSKCYGQKTQWETIDMGLELGSYLSPKPSLYGNSIITILKIDPKLYDLSLHGDEYGYTAKEWAKEENLLAVINAGMYDEYNKNLGYMRDHDVFYNSKVNKNNTVLAFSPKNKSWPPVKIIDLQYESWYTEMQYYNSFLQSIRMISLTGISVWSQAKSIWSLAVVAMDKDMNVLFIHSRSPYSVHDFINILLESDLNIKNAMYLEGGPPASLYVNHCDTEIKRIGSYESNLFDDNNNQFWSIPNIIGIRKKN
jgi:hypothetical protein